MKLIFDISNILFASYLMNYEDNFNDGFDVNDLENLVRSITIRHMCYLLETFGTKWKDLIIATDSGSWRKDYYKFYKQNRRKSKKDSKIDFDIVYKFFDCFIKELKEILPSPVMKVYNCEADDIIGTLALVLSKKEKVIIVSKDKDFIQLNSENIMLYDPFKKEFKNEVKIGSIKMEVNNEKDAKKYLLYHILMGDSIDGIPNLKSDDDVFVDPLKRQKPFGIKTIQKKLKTKDDLKQLVDEYYDNWKRNSLLIDLKKIPKEYKEKIIDEYNNCLKNNLTKKLTNDIISKYCEEHNLYETEEIFKRF